MVTLDWKNSATRNFDLLLFVTFGGVEELQSRVATDVTDLTCRGCFSADAYGSRDHVM